MTQKQTRSTYKQNAHIKAQPSQAHIADANWLSPAGETSKSSKHVATVIKLAWAVVNAILGHVIIQTLNTALTIPFAVQTFTTEGLAAALTVVNIVIAAVGSVTAVADVEIAFRVLQTIWPTLTAVGARVNIASIASMKECKLIIPFLVGTLLAKQLKTLPLLAKLPGVSTLADGCVILMWSSTFECSLCRSIDQSCTFTCTRDNALQQHHAHVGITMCD